MERKAVRLPEYPCNECGTMCVGIKGLTLHRRHMHPDKVFSISTTNVASAVTVKEEVPTEPERMVIKFKPPEAYYSQPGPCSLPNNKTVKKLPVYRPRQQIKCEGDELPGDKKMCFACHDCPRVVRGLRTLKKHYREHHRKIAPSNQFIRQTFAVPEEAYYAYKSQSEPTIRDEDRMRLLTCPTCCKLYSGVNALQIHHRRKHLVSLRATECRKMVATPEETMEHIEKVNRKRPENNDPSIRRRCPQCHAVFRGIPSMRSHFNRYHEMCISNDKIREFEVVYVHGSDGDQDYVQEDEVDEEELDLDTDLQDDRLEVPGMMWNHAEPFGNDETAPKMEPAEDYDYPHDMQLVKDEDVDDGYVKMEEDYGYENNFTLI